MSATHELRCWLDPDDLRWIHTGHLLYKNCIDGASGVTCRSRTPQRRSLAHPLSLLVIDLPASRTTHFRKRVHTLGSRG